MKFLNSGLLKFGLVGMAGLVIDFGATFICKEKLRLNKYLSNSIGFCLAVINNFFLNRHWTFEAASGSATQQFTSFCLIALAGLAINNLLLYVFVQKLRINFYVSKLLVTGIVFFWNYFMNCVFTFI